MDQGKILLERGVLHSAIGDLNFNYLLLCQQCNQDIMGMKAYGLMTLSRCCRRWATIIAPWCNTEGSAAPVGHNRPVVPSLVVLRNLLLDEQLLLTNHTRSADLYWGRAPTTHASYASADFKEAPVWAFRLAFPFAAAAGRLMTLGGFGWFSSSSGTSKSVSFGSSSSPS